MPTTRPSKMPMSASYTSPERTFTSLPPRSTRSHGLSPLATFMMSPRPAIDASPRSFRDPRAGPSLKGLPQKLGPRHDHLVAAALQKLYRRFDLGPHAAGSEFAPRKISPRLG